MNKLFLILLVFTLFSCQKENHHAFYYWKTSGKLNSTEKSILKDANIEKVYLKMFDVVWNSSLQMPVNTLPLQSVDSSFGTLEAIPVVYIKNEVFIEASDKQLDELPDKIIKLINSIVPDTKFNMIQLDCDWTQKTGNRYFNFLREIKKRSRKQISATIRLHQIKFNSQTGIPPVDCGTLMFYNMGDLTQLHEPNSILNIQKSEHYLSNLMNYPLKLDVALPVYSWAVLIRNTKVVSLLSDITEADLSDTAYFIPMKNNFYFAKSSFLLHGKYFFQTDMVRYEKVDFKAVSKAIKLLNNHLKLEDRDIILFHLDSTQIKQFGYENIPAVFAGFR